MNIRGALVNVLVHSPLQTPFYVDRVRYFLPVPMILRNETFRYKTATVTSPVNKWTCLLQSASILR